MPAPSMRSPSLFWRTLLLVLLLIVASLAAWIQSFRMFERAPRAQNIAQQVVSVVNVTRAALLYSDPVYRTGAPSLQGNPNGPRPVSPYGFGRRTVSGLT